MTQQRDATARTQKSRKKVHTAVIGAGTYGTGIVTQASLIPAIEITAVVDRDLGNAKRACINAGAPEDTIAVCDTRNSALSAIGSGKCVIAEDPMLIMDLPIDVIVESTGTPEAGAHHAHEAIRHGKHVVMVTKEADVVVGPILKHLADKAGLVYTAADGDQHGLLMGLISWAQSIGLSVVSGGKARNGEIIYDPISKTVSSGRNSIALTDDELSMFQPVSADQAEQQITDRSRRLARFTRISNSDIGELTIAANATGLRPHVPTLNHFPLYISEIPEVLHSSEDGGGIVDEVICLRYPHEAGLGGGVFIVVNSVNEYSRNIIKGGVLAQGSKGNAFLITRPYHLRGVETIKTILAAGLQGIATGASEYLPRYDLVLKANRDLEAGEILRNDADASALMMPAAPVKDGNPLPAYMAVGNQLAVNVDKGAVITRDMIAAPVDSALWSLRLQQDEHFLLHT